MFGVWGGVSDGGGHLNLKITLENESGQKTKKFRNLAFFYSKRASRLAGIEVETQKNENRPTYGDFGIWLPESPTSPNFKTHKRIILHNRNYIACKVYTLIGIWVRSCKTKSLWV